MPNASADTMDCPDLSQTEYEQKKKMHTYKKCSYIDASVGGAYIHQLVSQPKVV
jgi:hypothetical protein